MISGQGYIRCYSMYRIYLHLSNKLCPDIPIDHHRHALPCIRPIAHGQHPAHFLCLLSNNTLSLGSLLSHSLLADEPETTKQQNQCLDSQNHRKRGHCADYACHRPTDSPVRRWRRPSRRTIRVRRGRAGAYTSAVPTGGTPLLLRSNGEFVHPIDELFPRQGCLLLSEQRIRGRYATD